MKVPSKTIERGKAVIDDGKKLLTWVNKPGNIDAHDLWYNQASKFLAVNCPDHENKIGQVAHKYHNRILEGNNNRAVYEMISEQIEVFTTAMDTLVSSDDVLSNDLLQLYKQLKAVTSDKVYFEDLINTLYEIKITYDTQCWMACISLCGKVLEICLKEILEKNGISFTEREMIGGLLKKIESNQIKLDINVLAIGKIINSSRIGAIHNKNILPSDNECRMVVAGTLHCLNMIKTK